MAVSRDGCLVKCGRDESEQGNADYNEMHSGQEQYSQHLDPSTADTFRLTTSRTNALLHHIRKYFNSPPAIEQSNHVNISQFFRY